MYSFAYGVIAIGETSYVCFVCVHPRKTYTEGGNCNYADKLLFSNCLRVGVMLTLNRLTETRWGLVDYGLVKCRSTLTGNGNPLLLALYETCCDPTSGSQHCLAFTWTETRQQ